MERRLSAIFSIDMVGYSRLMEADETGTLERQKSHRRALIDPAFEEFHGRIVKEMGDGLLVEFPSVVEAVQCAVKIQEEMPERETSVSEDKCISYRIGINLGDVIVEGDDIYGNGVNVAARLQSVAEPGNICISASVHDQVVEKLAFDFIDLGELRLKNIEKVVRAYALTGALDGHRENLQAIASPGDGVNPFNLSQFKRPSMIVMPFKDFGGDEQTSLAEGLRLSLHSVLIKLPGLFLLHTGVVEHFRGQSYSSLDVGNEVDIRYIVGGAVQCSGKRVRVTVELTDTTTQQMVWGETYNRILDDIFDLQDEIAREIVKALDIELRAGDANRLRFETISNPSAREYFYRGISHLYQGDRENTLNARRMLEKADQIESDVAACLGLIALAHWRESRFGWSDDPKASLKYAAHYAQKTVDLGDPEGVGHTIMGYVLLLQKHHDKAMASSVEALSRRASCPLANGLLAEVMRYCGSPDQAITRMKEAMKLSRSFPPWMIGNLAASLRDDDQVKASISTANEAVELFPDDLDVLVTLCIDYDYSSSPKKAEAVARQILDTNPDFSIARYAESQPYKNKTTVDRIVESLNRAGLPN